jgi:hypothetical protein
LSENAAPDAVSSFEYFDTKAGSSEINRGRESGGPGSDDEDVRIHVGFHFTIETNGDIID